MKLSRLVLSITEQQLSPQVSAEDFVRNELDWIDIVDGTGLSALMQRYGMDKSSAADLIRHVVVYSEF